MFPKVPASDDVPIKVPLEFQLKPGWQYNASQNVFESDSGEIFEPRGLPKGMQIVYQAPALASAELKSLSKAEKELQRQMMLILPLGESASKFVNSVAEWKCVSKAHIGPEVSLPDQP